MTYLRFGIRELLWAIALLAMGLSWWRDRSDLAESCELEYVKVSMQGRELSRLQWEARTWESKDLRRASEQDLQDKLGGECPTFIFHLQY